MTFVDLLHPEDLDFVLGEWSKLAVDAEPCSFEFRWKWHRDNLTDEEKELGGQWVKLFFWTMVGFRLMSCRYWHPVCPF